MGENKKNAHNRIQPFILIIAIAVIVVFLYGAMQYFRSYTSQQLYNESVAQITELGTHLFDKLEMKLGFQWEYLNKVKNACAEQENLDIDGLTDIMLHYEKDLKPADGNLLFRALDSDGYYYTDAGRQGVWTGVDNVSGAERQSFLLANWLEDSTYMTFVSKLDEPIYVENYEITYFVLLRDMTEMEPFFHINAFNDRNASFITDADGTILAQSGSLPDIKFSGRNVFYNMDEQVYPHMGSFRNVIEASNDSAMISTDVQIDGKDYYLLYARLPEYDWSLLMLVDSDEVAGSTAELISSLLRIFIIFLIVLLVALLAVFFFVSRFHRNRKILILKEQNEKILESKNLELEKSQHETELALDTANLATKAKSQFLANMSHDIRTPMNAIVGVAKLMENSLDDPDRELYYIKKLQSSSQYMLGLINDVLDMSKIEAGEVRINYEPVKIADQVGQIESIIRSQANEKGQSFTLRVNDLSHEYVIGDSVRLRQVFLNLLTNAVKYTQPGGDILFELTELACDVPDHARIQTRVKDNGHGMSAEFLDHIFEPFTREVSSVTNRIQGTGLGMCIAKNIVDLMGGTISVESELDKGSCFEVTLTLPIDRAPAHETTVDSVLLLSADDELIRNVSASLKYEPLRLEVTASLDRAIDVLRKRPSDTVLLDDIPKDVVDMLRETSKDAVLIFCCDYAHREDLHDRLAKSGVDGFVSRPFFYENLVIAVQQARAKVKKAANKENHSTLTGKRFLCAEDNELNAEILEALLSMHGASCKICVNGEEIVKEFASVKEGDYDAILMDVQMPIMNGMDATRAIRASENTLGKTIPIIAMTANAFDSDVRACIAAGMDMHLAKPLEITALERAMQDIAGETSWGGVQQYKEINS